MIVNKKVSMTLIGVDGNAFSLMGEFQHQAKKQGWTQEEVDQVLEEAKKGDYDHLILTLYDHIDYSNIIDDEDDEDDEDDVII